MQLFRTGVASLGVDREGIIDKLEKRQEGTLEPTSPPASPVSTTASSTPASTSPETSSSGSGAAVSAVASATPSLTDTHDHTVTVFVTNPTYTATKTTAYVAPGVNATYTKPATSTYSAASYLATANATAPGIPGNELTKCQINGTSLDNGRFCSPIDKQNLWVGYIYAVTWNPALSPENANEAVMIKYNDGTGDVSNSSLTPHGPGYLNLYMDKAWLKGQAGNDSTSGQNMTLYLQHDPENDPANMTKGPTISLVVNPSTLPKVLIPKLPSRFGLEIGLPIGVVAALIIVFALWCGIRRNHRSWRGVRGHGKEYMARRARRRGRERKEGAIQLEDYNSPRGDKAFSDEDYTGGSGNAFRDEVARQRAEDDHFRPAVHSY